MADLISKRITATALARNLSNIIDQVRVSGSRMTITRANQDVAHIVPIRGNAISLSELSALLDRQVLDATERATFAHDLKQIHQSATIPASSWD